MIYIRTLNPQTLTFDIYKLWPFDSLPDFSYRFLRRLPGIHQDLYWHFPRSIVWYPLIWGLSVWFWKRLQQRKPCLEVWFRAFFLPVLVFFLAAAISQKFFSVALAAMVLFSFLFQSFFCGIIVLAANMFREGDLINIPEENICNGKVVAIDLMTTKIQLAEGGAD